MHTLLLTGVGLLTGFPLIDVISYKFETGGGVNMSTPFAPIEGLVNVWEREIPLTNTLGQCAADFFLRIIVVDANRSETVFENFAPPGQQR